MLTSRLVWILTTALLLVACGGASVGSSGGGSGDGGGGGGGGGGTSGFYLPFLATSTRGGETGLFVIPSDNLSTPPVFVTRTAASSQTVAEVGYSKKLTLNSANVVTSVSPYALIYGAVGSDGNAHLYAVHLSDSSVVPGATQVSTLSLGSVEDICLMDSGFAQTDVYDPTTLFMVLHTNAGGVSSCGKGGDVYQVVHYTDSPTTAPTVVNITPASRAPVRPGLFTALYQAGGKLGGLVLLDSQTGNLDFYGDSTFTHPMVLMTGVTAWSDIVDDSTVNNTGSVGASTAFLSVTTSSGTSVWRVTATGATSNVHTGSPGLHLFSGVADTNNVYFSDTAFQTGTETIYQEAMGGGTPLELYSVGVSGLTPPPRYSLVGSNGTVLVLTSGTLSGTGDGSTSVVTLPVGTRASPISIAGPFYGQMPVSIAMCPSTFGDVSSDDVVLTVTQKTTTGSTTTVARYSEVLTPGGAVKQDLLPNSAFLMFPVMLPGACNLSSGTVLQVRGITDTTGGYGGGTVNAFNLSSSSITALTTTTGSGNYFVPTGDDLLSLEFLSDVVGAGLVGSASTGVSSGLAFDVSKSLIVSVTVPNSDVSQESGL